MRALATISLLLLSACRIGGNVGTDPFTHTPDGTRIRIVTTSRATIDGELVAADDSALVVRGDSIFVAVPVDAIGSVSTTSARVRWVRDTRYRNQPGMASVPGGPANFPIERLRLLSRFPQGMSPEIERRLLARYRQAEVRRWQP